LRFLEAEVLEVAFAFVVVFFVTGALVGADLLATFLVGLMVLAWLRSVMNK
jgi:hypothetical protein